jgi:hypothetical protein
VQVYRGTWKYADIAAKEYLPPLPASGDDTPLGAEEAVAAAQVGGHDTQAVLPTPYNQ